MQLLTFIVQYHLYRVKHISYNMYMYVHVHACSSNVAGGRIGSYDTHTSGTGNNHTRVCKTKSTEIICYAINCITYVFPTGWLARLIPCGKQQMNAPIRILYWMEFRFHLILY